MAGNARFQCLICLGGSRPTPTNNNYEQITSHIIEIIFNNRSLACINQSVVEKRLSVYRPFVFRQHLRPWE